LHKAQLGYKIEHLNQQLGFVSLKENSSREILDSMESVTSLGWENHFPL